MAERVRTGLNHKTTVRDQDERKQLRQFGVIVGGIFAMIGVGPVLLRAEEPRLWALTLALALVVPALVRPRSLAYLYRIWMQAGHALGWINTRIILGVIFYGVVTPTGVLRRCFGRDPMQRRYEPEVDTYRVPKPSRPGTHMTRQF